jgi:alpha-beta hydrolase superfamily lysophospholipase
MKFIQKFTIIYLRLKFTILSFFSVSWAAKKAFVFFCTPKFRNIKAPTAIFNEAEKLELIFQNLRIAGYRWNLGKSKRMLVLHGFESSMVNFDYYITQGIKAGYEVLAFDAQAHGMSEGKTVNVSEYTALIKEIENKYGGFNFMLGHSFGGLAIALYLESLKEQKNIKAVLLAPATETTSAIDGYFSYLQLNKRLRKAFDQLIFDISGQWPTYYSARRAMQNIKAPILWIHDEEDKITPISDVKKVIADNHSNIEFMITQGLGHRRIYRDINVRKKVISFL